MFAQDKMTSPESTSDSSWNTAGIPTALATDEMGTDLGSMPPRPQTSLLGIDIVTGQMTDDTLARPVMYNVVDHATTRSGGWLVRTWAKSRYYRQPQPRPARQNRGEL